MRFAPTFTQLWRCSPPPALAQQSGGMRGMNHGQMAGMNHDDMADDGRQPTARPRWTCIRR